MTLSKILSLIFLILILSSCQKSFYMDVMHPAEIILENDLDTLVLVNRLNHNAGIKSTKGKLLEVVTTQSISTGNKEESALMFLAERIKVNKRISLATDDVLEINNSNFGSTSHKVIPENVIDSICKTYQANGVIALENISTEEKGATAEDHLRLTHTTWRLYASNEMLIDEITITTYGQSKPVKDLPSDVRITNAATQEAALTYLRRITPEYYKESRGYYGGYLANMKLAKKAMKIKDYALAKQYWEALAAKPGLKQKLQAQLAYNLALAFEIEGDLVMALRYAQEALKKGIPTAQRYIAQLELQIAEKPILKLQLIRE